MTKSIKNRTRRRLGGMGLDEIACLEVKPSVGETARDTSNPAIGAGVGDRPEFKLVKVQDYRNRYILSLLQKEAIGENPGFQPIHEETHRAKLVWVGEGHNRKPAGYYIYCERHFEHIKTLGREVCYPATFSQVFVTRSMRRMGLATLMMRDFIRHHSSGSIWVESPKYETRKLLNKLGYSEVERPYELWEMVEGLSRWTKPLRNDLVRAESNNVAADRFAPRHSTMESNWSAQEG